MNKQVLKAVLVLVIALGISVPVMAATSGQTQAQVGFFETTTVHYQEDAINRQIPNGETAYHSTKTTPTKKRGLTGMLVTQNRHLRLPQTDEDWTWYVGLLGMMLLAILVLGKLVWREKRALLMAEHRE